MDISPILLLVIGSVFALGYAAFITIGWAVTRRNRRNIQNASAISYVYCFNMENMQPLESEEKIKIVSLTKNYFVSKDGRPIDMSLYHPFLAKGVSERFPLIQDGDLILVDNGGNIQYAFEIPDLKHFR